MNNVIRNEVLANEPECGFSAEGYDEAVIQAGGCLACMVGAPKTRDGRHHTGFRDYRFYKCRADQLSAEQK